MVIIHTEPFYTGDFQAIGIFLKQFLARIAVPFFFVVSGYFFFNKAFIGKGSLRSVWKLVKVYTFWSIPYFLINIWVFSDEGIGILELVKKIVVDFFFLRSYYHFWFFPALIYATMIAYAIHRLLGFKTLFAISIVLYMLGCVGTTYSSLFSGIEWMNNIFTYEYFPNICRIFMTGLPFYVLGGLVVKIKELSSFKSKYTVTFLLIGSAMAFAVEKIILLIFDMPIHHPNTLMLYPLVGLVVIVLLNNPHCGYEKVAVNARICANFIYYVHPAFLLIADRIFVAVLGSSLHSAFMFVITVILLTVVGVLVSKISFLRKLLT